MRRPKLLDLCSGVGGAGVGYEEAGFDVYAVDLEPMPDNPHPFLRADALEVLAKLLDPRGPGVTFTHWYLGPGRGEPGAREALHLDDFAAVHASWPCQAANPLTTGTNAALRAAGRMVDVEHPQLIPAGRALMAATGLPWVIENTAGAPIRRDLTLNGDMFRTADGGYELGVWRPRYFELSGFAVPQPDSPRKPSRGRVRGWRHGVWHDGPYVAVYGSGGGKASVDEARAALGIDWTRDLRALAEAIPPAYTRYIGGHLLAHIRSAATTPERTAS